MDYEFLDQQARDDFQELVNELRQKMLGDQFQNLQQGLERMTQEDLGPIREMIAALNQLLAKHVRGGATEAGLPRVHGPIRATCSRTASTASRTWSSYLEQQAAQMASLLMSMPEEMRRQLEETMQALLQDDELQYDLMQMADLIEQITGRPLGRRYPFSGDDARRPRRGDGPHARPQRGRRAGAPAAPGDARPRLRQRRQGPAAASCSARTRRSALDEHAPR